ncbi:MAG: AarF/UbiB family protein [Planctomycetota bacterium]
MKLTSIPQVYRNANRWREILAVLSKHGLADLISRFDVPVATKLLRRGQDPEAPSLRREQRLRLAMEELGPAFIKLGQVLATRPDIVGVEVADELAKLQTAGRADGPEVVRATIESELGRPVEACFAEFDEVPVASASIGQVHKARLHDGREVAVKVRRDGVEPLLKVDTDILVGLAEWSERFPDLAVYRPRATAQEFRRTLNRELDFRDEMRRIQQFREAFDGDERVRIPEPHADLSATRVLTIEWFDGAKLSHPQLATATDADLAEVARHGAEVFLEMIFDHGLYHADPHPGNLLILPGGVIGLIDFGMVGRIGEALREDLEDVLLAIAADEPADLSAALLRIGARPRELDEEMFSAEVVDFVDRYGRQDLAQFDLTGALTDLFRLVRRHGIVLSPQLAMLLKLMVMLEGTAQRLAPKFNLIELLGPMQRKMILRRLNPVRHAKKARRLFGEVEELAEEMPRRIRDLLTQFQSGRFEVHLDHQGLEPSVNRLVLGLLTSALIVAGAMMVSRDVWPLYGVSAPGVVAFGISGLLGLRLVRAISKSGWLESR